MASYNGGRSQPVDQPDPEPQTLTDDFSDVMTSPETGPPPKRQSTSAQVILVPDSPVENKLPEVVDLEQDEVTVVHGVIMVTGATAHVTSSLLGSTEPAATAPSPPQAIYSSPNLVTATEKDISLFVMFGSLGSSAAPLLGPMAPLQGSETPFVFSAGDEGSASRGGRHRSPEGHFGG